MTSAYLINVGFHYGLDMFGAITLACLMRGCRNPEHEHRGLVGYLTRNPWLTQVTMALIVATILVHSFDLVDIAAHFTIDMAGALTLAWLLGLRDKSGPLSILGRNVWVTQSVCALVVAFATVHTIG